MPSTVSADAYSEQWILNPITDATICHIQCLAVGDTDGDGQDETVVACQEKSSDTDWGHLSVFVYGSHDMQYVIEWCAKPVEVDELYNVYTAHSLCIHDLDSDGAGEMLLSVSSMWQTALISFAWNGTGYDASVIGVWPFYWLAISDLDGDSDPELCGSDGYGFTVVEMTGPFAGGEVYVPLEDWPCDLDVADIDMDSRTEIVVGIDRLGFRSFEWDGANYTQDHYASIRDDWAGETISTGDFDSDGSIEVLAANCASTVRVCQWDGSYFREEWYRTLTASYGSVTLYNDVTGDIDGDGAPETVLSRRSSFDIDLHVIEVVGFENGSYVTEWVSEGYDTPTRALAIGDSDSDGDNELVIGAETCGLVRILEMEVPGQPHADLAVDHRYGIIGEVISMNASASYDPDVGQDLDYRWDFEGDGTWDQDWSAEAMTNHTYQATGRYTVVLAVRDVDGLTDVDIAFIQIFEPDLEPPITTAIMIYDSWESPGTDGWFFAPFNLWFEATDLTSLVAATYIKIDDGPWTVGSWVYVDDGSWSNISYYSVDVFGNVEDERTTEVKVDGTDPWTSVTISGSYGLDDWYVTEVNVTLYPSDYCSGIASTWYALNDGVPERYDGSIIVNTTGTHEVEYWSVDNAGNVEVGRSVGFQVDVDAPMVLVTPLSGSVIESDTVVLEFAPEDEADITRIEVYFDGDGPMVYAANTTSIRIPDIAPGDHTITVVVYDSHGNSREIVLVYTVLGEQGMEPWMFLSLIVICAGSAIAVAYYFVMIRPSRGRHPPGRRP